MARGAPVEADRLLGQVLLLAPVSRAYQRHGDLARRHLVDIRHREHLGCADEAADREAEGVDVEVRHGPVVADVMERSRRDETMLHQLWQRWLHVERMTARETDHVRMALDPLIRSAHIARVDLCGFGLL